MLLFLAIHRNKDDKVNKAKIVATFGPALDKPSVLKKAVKYIDIVRINFSHGNPEQWVEFKEKAERAANILGKELAFLADLPGPKIRLGKLDPEVYVRKGDTVKFGYMPKKTNETIPVNYPNLARDSRKGAQIIIGDGILRFKITDIKAGKIECIAENSGMLLSNKGISLKGASINTQVPTKEDLEKGRLAIKNGFDMLALSFVKNPESITYARRQFGSIPLVSKIERKEAVERIDEISKVSDAIMVARGDLALDVDIEEVPVMQRLVVASAMKYCKPVIVATQMLASMVENPMPTRAEVNDIASSVMQGADCMMLSDETAAGKYPIEALSTMFNTIANAEKFAQPRAREYQIVSSNDKIAHAAVDIANTYSVDAIFTPTKSGATARRISALRPRSRIIAMSSDSKVRRSLLPYFGVEPTEIAKYENVDRMLGLVHEKAKKMKARKYLVVFGRPNKTGSTDTLRFIEE